jgi:hypothetical protein
MKNVRELNVSEMLFRRAKPFWSGQALLVGQNKLQGEVGNMKTHCGLMG